MKMPILPSRPLTLLVLLGVATLLHGCGTGSGPARVSDLGRLESAPSMSEVRAVHAAPAPTAAGGVSAPAGAAIFRGPSTGGAPAFRPTGPAPMTSSVQSGVVRDGAHDAAFFQHEVRAGKVPRGGDVTVEGVFAQHTTAMPAPLTDRAITLHPLLGVSIDPRTNTPATVLQLGMSSHLDFSGLPRVPVNVAVVLDKSGSMNEANKMDYAKEGLTLMLDALDPSDTLSIVTYDTTAQLVMPPTPVRDRRLIQTVIESIYPGGATNLHDGLVLGLQQVARNLNPRGVNRVMLLSDGVPTVGPDTIEDLLAATAPFVSQGIGISAIGVGDDFNHELMLQLARHGGGSFYYLDDVSRVRTVFRDELETMLTPIAEDMTISLDLDERVSLTDTHGLPLTLDDDGRPTIRIPTVYLSRRNGVMLLELDLGALLDRTGAPQRVGTATFAYKLTGSPRHEVGRYEIILPPRQRTPQGELVFFEHPAVRKNFDLLMTVYGLQDACALYHDGRRAEAAAFLDSILDWLDLEARETEDVGLARELAVGQRLRGNLRLYGAGE